jgi:hypothetical protein
MADATGLPILRMYTGPGGKTRFAWTVLPLVRKTGLGSVGLFSELFVNENILDNAGDLRLQFAVTPLPKGGAGEGPQLAHTAPRKQLVLTLGGCLEFHSCDVETFDETTSATIGAGDILLAEDLVGAGHAWRFVPARDGPLKPWRRCYIHLGDEYDHFVELLRPS